MKSALLGTLRAALADAADSARAEQMQRYMKSSMPYHGVPMPVVRQICKKLFADLTFATHQGWRLEVLALFDGARFREEWYGALALSGHKRATAFQTPEAIPLYEHFITTAAWWDVVDDVAEHRVGPIVRAFPKVMKPMMRSWSRDDDLWKRRTSIICQMFFKEETDLALLYDCIAPSLDSKEFFLRKAIGWALRQYAKTDAAEVKRYVRAHADRLSPLSQREALKHSVGKAS